MPRGMARPCAKPKPRMASLPTVVADTCRLIRPVFSNRRIYREPAGGVAPRGEQRRAAAAGLTKRKRERSGGRWFGRRTSHRSAFLPRVHRLGPQNARERAPPSTIKASDRS
jgi:hypothetical protein